MNFGFFLLFLIPVPVCIIVYTLGLLKNGIRSMRMILFGFSMACMALTDTYWFIFDLMYEGKELPFAANELGEWGLFLLLGATLVNGVKPKRVSLVTEMILMLIFVAGNVALWIYWSGEWLQDLATGGSLAYLLYALIRKMKYSGKFSAPEWILMALAAFAGTGFQAITVVLPESLSKTVEGVGYGYLLISSLVLLILTILALVKTTERSVCLAFALLIWCTFSMYMSSGICYLIELFGTSAATLLMFLSLRKEMLFDLNTERAASKSEKMLLSQSGDGSPSQSEEVGSL